jgi:CheY-like chemotaxis protein
MRSRSHLGVLERLHTFFRENFTDVLLHGTQPFHDAELQQAGYWKSLYIFRLGARQRLQDYDRDIRILIIEDNPGDVRLLKDALKELNAPVEIRVASDGAEGLQITFDKNRGSDSWHPDLIFLDLNLPKIGGHEVLARLKADPDKRLIPVIVLSSSRAENDINRAYEAHANAYIRKPSSLDDLMNAVRGLKSFWIDTVRLPKVPEAQG